MTSIPFHFPSPWLSPLCPSLPCHWNYTIQILLMALPPLMVPFWFTSSHHQKHVGPHLSLPHPSHICPQLTIIWHPCSMPSLLIMCSLFLRTWDLLIVPSYGPFLVLQLLDSPSLWHSWSAHLKWCPGLAFRLLIFLTRLFFLRLLKSTVDVGLPGFHLQLYSFLPFNVLL